LALEPDLAEAHASLGIANLYQRKFDEAEKELKRAIELNPNYAMAHHWYAMHLVGMGRMNEALAENDRARRLDPFSFPVNFFRSGIMIGMHEYDEAIEQLETAAAINPQAHAVHQNLARIYWIQGKGGDALSEEREEANLEKDPAKLRDLEQVAGIFGKEGLRAALLQSARINEKVCIQNVAQSLPACDEFAIARQYGLLGETEKLLFWLKRGLARRVGDRNAMLAISLKTAPEFDCCARTRALAACCAASAFLSRELFIEFPKTNQSPKRTLVIEKGPVRFGTRPCDNS
jgi:tetratricopeptide (TPR) repeat protein